MWQTRGESNSIEEIITTEQQQKTLLFLFKKCDFPRKQRVTNGKS